MSGGCGCVSGGCVDECQMGVYRWVWMSVRWVCTGGVGVWISG